MSGLVGLFTFRSGEERTSFEAIQYLRAVAAIMVVYYHGLNFLPANSGMPVFGMQGVDIFFVISGFIMAYTAMQGNSTGQGWQLTSQFWWKRLIRIVPLYLIATVYAWKSEIFSGGLGWSTIQDVLFIPHFSVERPGHIWPKLIPGWTINYEMFFYFVFGLSLMLGRWAIAVMLTVFGSLVVAGYLLVDPASQNAQALFYTDPIVLEFCFGVLVFICFRAFVVAAALPLSPPVPCLQWGRFLRSWTSIVSCRLVCLPPFWWLRWYSGKMFP